jgi:hypothetical protein
MNDDDIDIDDEMNVKTFVKTFFKLILIVICIDIFVVSLGLLMISGIVTLFKWIFL